MRLIGIEQTSVSGRSLPSNSYPGATASYHLDAGEELEWRRWKPSIGHLVIVDIPEKGKWPGKVSFPAKPI